MEFNVRAFIKKNNYALYIKPNEDYLVLDPESAFFMVADGVTRDATGSIYPDPSPASKASELFCRKVHEIWRKATSAKNEFREVIGKALLDANAELKKFNETDFLGKNEYEAGTVAIVAHIYKGLIRLYYNGDCGCHLIRNGERIQLTIPQTLLVSKNRETLSRKEIRKEIQNNISHPWGFGVFNGDTKVAAFIEYKEIGLLPGDVIWLYSDGCEPAFNRLTPSFVFGLSPEELVIQAEQIEQSENLRSDDKALIKIEYKGNEKMKITGDFEIALANQDIMNAFEAESKHICDFIKDEGLQFYFDLGCWYGLLLNMVLERCPQILAIAFDGVRDFIEIAKTTCKFPERASFINTAIIPQSRVGIPYRFNVTDSSKSGLDTQGTELSEVPIISVKKWCSLAEVKNRSNTSYLKLDLEGIDFDIIIELLALGFLPAVIHFEVLKRTRQQLWKLLALLEEYGYSIPKHLPQDHGFHSVICSKKRSVILGFKPLKSYVNG